MVKKFNTFINEGVDEKDKINEITKVMPLMYNLIDKVKEKYYKHDEEFFIIYKDVPGEDHIVAFVCANNYDNKLVVLSDSIDISKLKGNIDKLVEDIIHSADKNNISGRYVYNPHDDIEEDDYEE